MRLYHVFLLFILFSVSACVSKPINISTIQADKKILAAIPYDLDASIYVAVPYLEDKGGDTVKITKYEAFKKVGVLSELEKSVEEVAKKYFTHVSLFSPDKKAKLYIIFSGRFTTEQLIGSLTAYVKGTVYDADGNFLYEKEVSGIEVTGGRLNNASLYNAVVKAQVDFYNQFFQEKLGDLYRAKSIEKQFINKVYSKLPSDRVRATATASGFLINKKGQMLTNHHAINGCLDVSVQLNGKDKKATVIHIDEELDLAVLNTAFAKMPHAYFSSNNNKPRLGEDVVVVGFPLQGVLTSKPSLTTGNISALAGIKDNESIYQITAPVQSGNSGGPMLNNAGMVIGIIQSKLNAVRIAKYTGDVPQNVNFAVKYDKVLDFLSKNKVPHSQRKFKRKISTPDIADKVSKYVVGVSCKGYVEILNRKYDL